MTDFYSETHFTLTWPPEACDWALRFKAALDQAANDDVAAVADQEWRALLRRFYDDPPCVGFDLTRSSDGLKVSAPGFLCAESLAIFIQAVLQTFDLPPVEFEWANYAHGNIPDIFGGGACVVRRDKIVMMTTTDWLMQMKLTPPPEPTAAIAAWLRRLQPNLSDALIAQQTGDLLTALNQSRRLPHPAPNFVTTVIAQEINQRMERVFGLLSQLDEALKQGLPTSLPSMNAALDLNAGHLNGTITYEQWRALYQPIMTDGRPHCFSDEALPHGLLDTHHIWTLLPSSTGANRGIYPGYYYTENTIHFLTGVPWNNEALVVLLDEEEPAAIPFDTHRLKGVSTNG
jgi:hypothetical protein